MREVKEKSPLKERTVKTLKSAPQAAFRRGTDASFQQLRQELREAAQDGQPEDRYESSKITDTAGHAVRQVSHLAEKAVHKLPKTKSESQREARTESVPQHEQPRHPRQPTAAPREYPPVSVQPSYPPQIQSQTNWSVRELETSVREKPAGKARPAKQRSLGQVPASAEPSAPATTPTVQPSARTLPKEKPLVSSLREIPAALKTDTTQFALPEIKTKEYIRKKRKKQHLLKEEASGNIFAGHSYTGNCS